ncbi:MAG: sigma 54-interacting transcriptional regulator [Xanthomonadales bacterium]|nr:sigma 54-interacting transcriptional regulator [Xanthomonadales bacterium]
MERLRYSIERLDGSADILSRTQLDVGRYRLGRSAECEIRLDIAGISRQHLEIEVFPDGGLALRDLGSTNGCRVDGRPVSALALAGDFELDLGAARLRLREHTPGIDALAFVMPGEDEQTAPRPATLAPGQTRALALFDQLREAALAALPDGMLLAGPLSRVLQEWLSPLSASGLRLADSEGRVLAQAGEAATWEVVVMTGDWQLAADAGSAARLRTVSTRLVAVLSWLPAACGVGAAGPASAADALSGAPGTANPAMRTVLETAARAARSRVAILLRGETGVGKEVLARWIHSASPRGAGAFVAVNCAALPRDLLEAELFGVEKGAATGVEARPGLLERADGGTLFLDELGDMPLETQVRLLRALEDGRVMRVGGRQQVEVDVRLLAATHQDLAQAIAERRFRLDLYHRVAGIELQIPPLRERPEDIATLAIGFFARAVRAATVRSPGIGAEALLCLQRWHWPGNVRELRQAIEGAVAMLAPGEALSRQHLPTALRGEGPRASDLTLAAALARAEHGALLQALAVAGGDHRRARDLLGIGKTTFYKLLRSHGLSRQGDPDDD